MSKPLTIFLLLAGAYMATSVGFSVANGGAGHFIATAVIIAMFAAIRPGFAGAAALGLAFSVPGIALGIQVLAGHPPLGGDFLFSVIAQGSRIATVYFCALVILKPGLGAELPKGARSPRVSQSDSP